MELQNTNLPVTATDSEFDPLAFVEASEASVMETATVSSEIIAAEADSEITFDAEPS